MLLHLALARCRMTTGRGKIAIDNSDLFVREQEISIRDEEGVHLGDFCTKLRKRYSKERVQLEYALEEYDSSG